MFDVIRSQTVLIIEARGGLHAAHRRRPARVWDEAKRLPRQLKQQSSRPLIRVPHAKISVIRGVSVDAEPRKGTPQTRDSVDLQSRPGFSWLWLKTRQSKLQMPPTSAESLARHLFALCSAMLAREDAGWKASPNYQTIADTIYLQRQRWLSQPIQNEATTLMHLGVVAFVLAIR